MQEFTSKKTSINTISKVYKTMLLNKGMEILDYGGGRFNANTEYLALHGVTCLVYDPYNRSQVHNETVLNHFLKKGGSSLIVCANVLNVIKEDNIILDILNHIKDLLKTNGKIYIQIYEGLGNGNSKETTKGYQRHKKTKDYISFVEEVFAEYKITKKGNIITIQGD